MLCCPQILLSMLLVSIVAHVSARNALWLQRFSAKPTLPRNCVASIVFRAIPSRFKSSSLEFVLLFAWPPHGGFKWYCRHQLWRYADHLGYSSVTDLPADEYVHGLHVVNDHFRQHPAARVPLGLQPFSGPQRLADRGTHREDVLGTVRLFEYYDRRFFLAQLRSLRPSPHPGRRNREGVHGSSPRASTSLWNAPQLLCCARS